MKRYDWNASSDDNLEWVGRVLMRAALVLIALFLLGASMAIYSAYNNACAHPPPGKYYNLNGQQIYLTNDYYDGYIAGYTDGAKWAVEQAKGLIDSEVGSLRADQQQMLDKGWLQGYNACKAGK